MATIEEEKQVEINANNSIEFINQLKPGDKVDLRGTKVGLVFEVGKVEGEAVQASRFLDGKTWRKDIWIDRQRMASTFSKAEVSRKVIRGDKVIKVGKPENVLERARRESRENC